MKMLGLIGGMSWESSIVYYQQINLAVSKRLGGLHSASLILSSLNFQEIATLQAKSDWNEAGRILGLVGASLERVGAKGLVLCTNTMHYIAPQIEEATRIPLLHIADFTGHAVQKDGISIVGLLGTKFTMEKTFYRDRLNQKFDLKVITPDVADRERIHQIIFEELCVQKVSAKSKGDLLDIIQRLSAKGVRAIILGCTELGLLLKQTDCPIPLYDTTLLHAEGAVEWAMKGE